WNGTGKVKRYQLDGTFVDDFTAVGVSQSIGLDWDQSGNLYVSSYGGKLVRKFDTAGQDSGVFISANLLGPTNIWFDVNGDLLVTDYNGTAVKRFDHSGTYLGDFITGLSKAEGMAFLPDGHILIGNGASKSVKEFDAGGAYVGERISGGSGGLLTPNAVVIREVASSGLNEIDRHQWAVTPSLGVEFKLSIPETMDVQMVAVYDMLGNVVEELSASSTGTWNAQDHPQGIYLIAVATSDGLMTSHRVVVKRN
ncbi:MAG: T9SS type A sorting domain-containing protein, partial [Flavobacteriales bacterium]|nr:T9SS type A sorting domain-containing protein [Flavobacteriales bacterium]